MTQVSKVFPKTWDLVLPRICRNESLAQVTSKERFRSKIPVDKFSSSMVGIIRRAEVFLGPLLLNAVVHAELDRVSGHVQALDFFSLQFDIAVDHIIGEDTAGGQESTICI